MPEMAYLIGLFVFSALTAPPPRPVSLEMLSLFTKTN